MKLFLDGVAEKFRDWMSMRIILRSQMSNTKEHISNKMYTQRETERKTLKTTFVKYWRRICL